MPRFCEFKIINDSGQPDDLLVNINTIMFCRRIKYTLNNETKYGTFMALQTPLYDDQSHKPVNTNCIICEPFEQVKKKIYLKG